MMIYMINQDEEIELNTPSIIVQTSASQDDDDDNRNDLN